MYCPAPFQEDRPEVLHRLMTLHPLATVITSGPDGPVADHVPLMHEPAGDGHGRLIGHVARGNPLWRAAPGQPHLIVFQGPSSYISPNWYATKRDGGKVVPTWNYAVVHVHATLKADPSPQALLAVLNKLTDHHEARQAHPWRLADAPADFTERLLVGIVAVEFAITRIEGKWKVSQNQPPVNQRSVAQGLEALGGEAACMAGLVRRFGDDKEESPLP